MRELDVKSIEGEGILLFDKYLQGLLSLCKALEDARSATIVDRRATSRAVAQRRTNATTGTPTKDRGPTKVDRINGRGDINTPKTFSFYFTLYDTIHYGANHSHQSHPI